MAQITYEPSVPIEIEHNGVKYVYTFDELTIEQVNSAVVLFNLYNEMLQSPPKDVRTLEASGMTDMMPRALAYLLLQKHGDDLQAWSNKQYADTLGFIRGLKAKEFHKLTEVKNDFFAKANIVDVESLKPLKGLLSAFEGLNLGQLESLKNLGNPATINSSASNDSINPTSTTED